MVSERILGKVSSSRAGLCGEHLLTKRLLFLTDDFKVIARKGTIATFGNASGAVEPFPPLKLAAKNVKGQSLASASFHSHSC